MPRIVADCQVRYGWWLSILRYAMHALCTMQNESRTMLTLYIVSTILLILAPGTNMMMMLALASSQGSGAGRWAALGLAVGVSVHTLVAATGGALLLQQWPAAMLWLQWVGSAYLVYLGGSLAYRQIRPRLAAVSHTSATLHSPFVQGVISSISNTKTLVLFVSFLPQFMHATTSVPLQFVQLGGIYAVLTLIIYGVIGSLAGWAGGVLQRPTVQRVMRIVAGLVIAGLGVWGIVSEMGR